MKRGAGSRPHSVASERPACGRVEVIGNCAASRLPRSSTTPQLPFVAALFDKRSRTVDQMVQAARSGRQNIAEGSRASATSSQTELRLVNVARASLDELLLDYEDFSRQRHLPLWGKDSPEALKVRRLGREGRPGVEATIGRISRIGRIGRMFLGPMRLG